MGAGFAGGADLTTIEEFISTSFNFPDFKPVSETILGKVEGYLKENLPKLPEPYLQKNNDEVVRIVSDEFKKARGPDFYILPGILTNFGVNKDAAESAMKELQNMLENELTKAVKDFDELPGGVSLPRNIEQNMIKAIKGGLDYVFTDIQQGDKANVDFFLQKDKFGKDIGTELVRGLKTLKDEAGVEYVNDLLLQELVETTGK